MQLEPNEIDSHIAEQFARALPSSVQSSGRRPMPNRRVVRQAALITASLVASPMIGFWAANSLAERFQPVTGLALWSVWMIWLAIWAGGSELGCRIALRGRLSRRSKMVLHAPLLAAPFLAAVIEVLTQPSGGFPAGFIACAIAWFTLWLGSILLACRPALHSGRQTKRANLLNVEDMQAVFPQLALTRAERLYCDVLLFLARTETNAETEMTMRDTLRQLNAVIVSSRHLENRRRSLLPLMGANVVSELQAEYIQMKHRRDKSIDAVSRASLDQSLDMVTTRMENARNLEVGLERLNVQQEVIAQTLASTLSSLARMQVMSDHSADHSAHFAVQNITQTVTQLNQQTVAIEQAVQEVMTLTVSG